MKRWSTQNNIITDSDNETNPNLNPDILVEGHLLNEEVYCAASSDEITLLKPYCPPVGSLVLNYPLNCFFFTIHYHLATLL